MNDAVSFFVAFGAALGLTPLLAKLAHRTGVVARPNPLVSNHTKSTAYLGGSAVFLALAAGTLAQPISTEVGRLLVAAGLMHLLGLVDDLRPLTVRRKLLGECLVASILIGQLSPGDLSALALLQCGALVFWLLVTTNAVNLLDVMDGLVSSVAAIGFLGVYFVVQHESPDAGRFALACCGALSGFLVYNWHRASIFLGDAGSLMIGFLAGAMPLASGRNALSIEALVATLMLFVIPIGELIFLVIMRTRRHIPFWLGSRDHFSLRLLSCDWPVRRIVGLSDLAAATAVACAVIFSRQFPEPRAWLAVTPVLVGVTLAGYQLSRIKIDT